MDKFLVAAGAIGIACTVAPLIGMAIAMSKQGNWLMVLGCLASLSLILFLTLVGLEYADEFWKGR